ncbi:MAG: hypothetical protein KatS3mg114_0871 [Planctomycetaceae bacterium]|nr:MAG: hypothetical protein KatS3mg114_0871 [Planctomycetaceae bacterium]
MRRTLERGEARRDGVVGARFDLHVVRRVGVAEMDRLAIEQPVEVCRLAAVPTEQAMLAEYPQVAGLRDRFVRRRGNLVRIGQSFLHAGIEQLGELVLVEPEQTEIEVHPL